MLIRTFCLVLVFGNHAPIFSCCFHFDPVYTHTSSTYIYIYIVQEDGMPKITFSHTEVGLKKDKDIAVTDHEGYKVVRRRGSHSVQTFGSQMAVSLSALRVTPPFTPPGRYLVLICVRV
jgi:hypothetical protein